MCLHNISLNTKKTKNGFVGIGYKALFDKPKLNVWKKAKRTGGCNELSDTSQEYYPGFHIFLDIKDAINYDDVYNYIVEVSFKEIICFGTNIVYNSSSGDDYFRNCVVANWMKINKIIQR